jgi:hypothetical protein
VTGFYVHGNVASSSIQVEKFLFSGAQERPCSTDLLFTFRVISSFALPFVSLALPEHLKVSAFFSSTFHL